MIESLPGAERLTAAGDQYTGACRIIGVLWVGGTTTGDVALIKGRNDSKNRVMWAAQTDSSNTYLGAIWGPPGIHAPDGFKVEQLSAGILYVYLSQ